MGSEPMRTGTEKLTYGMRSVSPLAARVIGRAGGALRGRGAGTGVWLNVSTLVLLSAGVAGGFVALEIFWHLIGDEWVVMELGVVAGVIWWMAVYFMSWCERVIQDSLKEGENTRRARILAAAWMAGSRNARSWYRVVCSQERLIVWEIFESLSREHCSGRRGWRKMTRAIPRDSLERDIVSILDAGSYGDSFLRWSCAREEPLASGLGRAGKTIRELSDMEGGLKFGAELGFKFFPPGRVEQFTGEQADAVARDMVRLARLVLGTRTRAI